MPLYNVDYCQIETPIGAFVLAAREGALKGGWFIGQKYFPDIDAAHGWQAWTSPVLREARRQIDAWFAGRLKRFDLPLALEGTPFQQQVWAALYRIPWGQTASYAELAQQIGRPEAFHPVGAAVAHNPLLVVVPCHRAIGSDGSMTGYAGGVDRKRWLLDFESGQGDLFGGAAPCAEAVGHSSHS